MPNPSSNRRAPLQGGALPAVLLLASLLLAPFGAAGQVDSTTSDSISAEQSEPEAISQERSDVDETLRQGLQAIFDRVEEFSDVDVTVEAGIVRLRGTVAEVGAAERAEELVRSQDGVLVVENDIELTRSLERQLQPTWDRLRNLGYDVLATLPLAVVALMILLLFSFMGNVAGRWGGPSFLRSRNPFLQTLIQRAIRAAFVLAGLLIGLDLLNATALVGAIAGTAGLAGLAVGFAFKDIVQNYLAGLLLAVRQPFGQNHHVVIEGHEGKVVRMTPRETILMTLEGNHIRLPNAMVFGSPLLDYTRNPYRRFSFDAGVGPVDDLEVARNAGMAVLREMKQVLDDPPPEALVVELGESWVTVRFFGWVDQRQAEFMRVRSEAVRLVKARLEDAGISLPSPEYIVRLKRGEGGPVSPSQSEATRPTAAEATTTEADVSVDRAVDQQVEDELRSSDEQNLLES
jgi:small conductance mechanosensitive channel